MNIFHSCVNFLVNMDSLHGNMTNVCLNLFITGHLLFWTLICHHLFQNKFCNFGWPFNRDKDNRKPSWGRPKDGHSHLIEVAGLWVFYLQYFTDNNLGTLITVPGLQSAVCGLHFFFTNPKHLALKLQDQDFKWIAYILTNNFNHFTGMVQPKTSCWFAVAVIRVTILCVQCRWQILQKSLVGSVR